MTNLNFALTPHVTLSELTRSATATRLGIDNTPTKEIHKELKRLAEMIELLRSELGSVPILISSGYRCSALNKVVGGAANSAHRYGRAVDFTAPQFGSPEEICRLLEKSQLPFDQLIYENRNGKQWVHLGIAKETALPRRQVLSITNSSSK